MVLTQCLEIKIKIPIHIKNVMQQIGQGGSYVEYNVTSMLIETLCNFTSTQILDFT
jgi:hypothetical protein